ncbi:MAG: cysteine--tRNA ligase, partial [Candidatus Marinimicrobia bacterium]|nr:cysteine--tRNA ligase [Candidatus Neomarinimicrobiota bacterium]
FVKYWVHCEHLILEGEKMSKSLGNIKLLKDLIGDGYSPEAIRLALLSTHYRSKLDLTEAKLKEAEKNASKLMDYDLAIWRIKDQKGRVKDVDYILIKAKQQFEDGLDDDLNISKAMAAIFDMMNGIYKLRDSGVLRKNGAQKAMDQYNKFRKVIGIPYRGMIFGLSDELIELVEERESLRKKKKWEEADKIRDELLKQGIILEDVPDGPPIVKIPQ